MGRRRCGRTEGVVATWSGRPVAQGGERANAVSMAVRGRLRGEVPLVDDGHGREDGVARTRSRRHTQGGGPHVDDQHLRGGRYDRSCVARGSAGSKGEEEVPVVLVRGRSRRRGFRGDDDGAGCRRIPRAGRPRTLAGSEGRKAMSTLGAPSVGGFGGFRD
nr:unnamed protein product [Digitaria exilis]